MYTGGGGPVCRCTVECTLGVQLSGTACLTEKPSSVHLMGAYCKWRGLSTKDPDFLFLIYIFVKIVYSRWLDSKKQLVFEKCKFKKKCNISTQFEEVHVHFS